MSEILTEVSSYAPKILRDMEKTIGRLKNTKKNYEDRIRLVQQIKEFTKIHEVVIYYTDEFNCGVVSVYKEESIYGIIKTLLNRLEITQEKITPSELKKLISVKESSDLIERIYIIIGRKLLKALTPAEMVAVLLHEIGHTFHSASSIPDTVLVILKRFVSILSLTVFIGKVIGEITMPLMKSILFMIITMSIEHGIGFIQRLDETAADNYALKYGYGDELVGVLMKFRGKITQPRGIGDWIKKMLVKLIRFVLFIYFSPAHPSEESRIRNIENQIFDKYKQLYPNYKEVLERVQSDYNKQGVPVKA